LSVRNFRSTSLSLSFSFLSGILIIYTWGHQQFSELFWCFVHDFGSFAFVFYLDNLHHLAFYFSSLSSYKFSSAISPIHRF
jgi:hypothetical protein